MPLTFNQKVNNLPEPVKKILFSAKASEETFKTITSYIQDEKIQSKIAKLIGLVFINDVALERLSEVMQKELVLSDGISSGLSAELAKINFLPVKEHFPNVENLIGQWKQKALPPTFQPKSLGLEIEKEESDNQQNPQAEETAEPPDETILRNISEIITEREEIGNQNITEKPLKFVGSENLKMPNIKNWLEDYKQYKSNFPDQDLALVRAKYLHENQNGKNLNEKEKIIITNLLKSLDTYLKLPFSKNTGLLLYDQLMPLPEQPPAQNGELKKQVSPTPPPGLPTQAPPPSVPEQKDTYREKVAQQDLAGPQAPQKPEPKLNGNIINLRDFNSGQQ